MQTCLLIGHAHIATSMACDRFIEDVTLMSSCFLARLACGGITCPAEFANAIMPLPAFIMDIPGSPMSACLLHIGGMSFEVLPTKLHTSKCPADSCCRATCISYFMQAWHVIFPAWLIRATWQHRLTKSMNTGKGSINLDTASPLICISRR